MFVAYAVKNSLIVLLLLLILHFFIKNYLLDRAETEMIIHGKHNMSRKHDRVHSEDNRKVSLCEPFIPPSPEISKNDLDHFLYKVEQDKKKEKEKEQEDKPINTTTPIEPLFNSVNEKDLYNFILEGEPQKDEESVQKEAQPPRDGEIDAANGQDYTSLDDVFRMTQVPLNKK